MKRLIALFFCLLSLGVRLGATDYFFRPINLAEGLPQMSVVSIYQDEEGFMWFATRQGLARYDGTDIRVFHSLPDDSSSLCSPIVEQICGDGRGHIYIRTQGINLYDLHTATLSRLVAPSSALPQTMTATDSGMLYMAGNRLFRYTLATHALDTLFAVPDSLGRVCTMHICRGQLWAGTEQGDLLCLGHAESIVSTPSPTYATVAHYHLGSQVSFVYEDSAHTLWAGTWSNGLYSLSAAGLRHFGTESGLLSNYVRAAWEDRSYRLWIGTDIGLQCLADSATYLRGQSVWSLYGDRSGNLWVGTYFDGISYFNPSIDFYRHIPLAFTSFPVISSMQELTDGSICLMTEGSGLYIVSPEGVVLRHFNTANIKSFHYDAANEILYLGTHLGGLYCLDIPSWRLTQYTLPTSHYGNHIVRSIVALGDTLLLGTHNGVYAFSRQSRSFSVFADTLSVLMPKVVTMQSDGTTLYLGGDHLLAFDLHTRCVHTLPLACAGVEKLLLDKEQRLWIGTDGNGLYIYRPEDDTLQHINGLQNDYVRNLLLTQAGHILTITTRGFSLVAPDTYSIANYTPGPYMPLSSLYNGGACLTRSGEIWLAGMDGMLAFREENLRHLPVSPRILLTGLYINSVEQTCTPPHPSGSSALQRPITYTDTVILRHEQDNLLFRYVVSSDYLFADNFVLRYAVEHDEQAVWQPLSAYGGEIRLMNLPIGKNLLRLQVLDEASGALLSERVLTLEVLAPWYLSTPALVVYVLLFAALLAGIIYWENKRVKKALRKQASDQYTHLREEIEHYLTEHLTDSELDVNKLCRQMGVGRTRLFLVFREIYDTTPQQLIAERRLQTAADWLLNKPNLNISEIAYDLGFQSPKYFARCFKERFGVTPTQYRRQSHD